MLESIKKSEVDYLIAYNLDRLSRNEADLRKLSQLMGIGALKQIITVDKKPFPGFNPLPFKPDKDDGVRKLIKSDFAEYEKLKFRERMIAGKKLKQFQAQNKISVSSSQQS